MSTFRPTAQIITYTTLILLLTSCFKANKVPIVPNIIPVPNQQIKTKGVFILNSDTKLTYDDSLKSVADFFKSYLENGSNIKLNTSSKNSPIVQPASVWCVGLWIRATTGRNPRKI